MNRPEWLDTHAAALVQAEADALDAQDRMRALVLARQNRALGCFICGNPIDDCPTPAQCGIETP